MLLKEIEAKSILTKTKLPSGGYIINPYVGCSVGCAYCYARFMKRMTGHKEPWGTFVDAKVNAVEVLKKEMKNAKKDKVGLSSVTDPYLGIEGKYKLTRGILEVLLEHQFPLWILTKSSLVLRDIDLLKKFKEAEVGITVTGLDDKAKRLIEPGASPHKERIETLRTLHKNGVKTYAFIGPVLPFFIDLKKVFEELDGNVDEIMVESLNTMQPYWENLEKIMKEYYPELLPKYKEIFFTEKKKEYLEDLRKEINRLGKEHKIKVKMFLHK
jgi:DNA repair photolyase